MEVCVSLLRLHDALLKTCILIWIGGHYYLLLSSLHGVSHIISYCAWVVLHLFKNKIRDRNWVIYIIDLSVFNNNNRYYSPLLSLGLFESVFVSNLYLLQHPYSFFKWHLHLGLPTRIIYLYILLQKPFGHFLSRHWNQVARPS